MSLHHKKLFFGLIAVVLIFFATTFLKNWGKTVAEKNIEDFAPKVKTLKNNYLAAKKQCPEIIGKLKEGIADLDKPETKLKKLLSVKLIADCYAHSKQYSNAAEYYSQLAQAEPQQARWYGAVAENTFKAGRAEEAIRLTHLATQLEPNNYKWLIQEARISAKLGLYEKAQNSYEKALKILPFEDISKVNTEYEVLLAKIQQKNAPTEEGYSSSRVLEDMGE
jgi:tetratricopeptide (TPR) repeat protein